MTTPQRLRRLIARIEPWSAAALVPFLLISLSYWDSIPIWDSREYADCITRAARVGSFPADYACAGHPTLAYTFITALLSHLIPLSYPPLLVMNVAIGVLALLAFRAICVELFPGHEQEAALLTACLGVMPVFIGAAISVNPDFGVVSFFLALVLALLRRRFWAAAAFGLLLSFTKETGVLLLLLAVCLHALLFVARGPGSLRDKLRGLRPYLLALLPLLFFGVWLLSTRQPGQEVFWGNRSTLSLIEMFTSVSLLEERFLGHLSGIFVLQFFWVVSAAALVRWLRKLGRAAFDLPGKDSTALVYLDALFFVALLLLTRYRAYLNLRYYLALFPLLLLCGYAAISALRRAVRLALVGVVGVLFLASAYRTIDPIARRIVGTFAFGNHPMLAMTRLGDSCCGYGRDQIAYNLEHAQFHYLMNEIFAFARPGPGRALLAVEDTDWHLVGLLDPVTFQRTLERRLTLRVPLWPVAALRPGPRPPEAYFIRFPNLPQGNAEAELARWYDRTGERRFERQGYFIDVSVWRLRSPGQDRPAVRGQAP